MSTFGVIVFIKVNAILFGIADNWSLKEVGSYGTLRRLFDKDVQEELSDFWLDVEVIQWEQVADVIVLVVSDL